MNNLQNNTKAVYCCAVVFLSLVFGGCLWAQTDTDELAAFSKLTKCLAEFTKTKSLDLFDEAFHKMERIDNIERQNSDQHRKEHTRMWLEVVSAIDQVIDPTFDAAKTHYSVNLVPPPDGEGGPVYFSGVAPSELKDPKARAQYEAAIKANEEQKEPARVQFALRNRKRIAVLDLQYYLKWTYTASEADRKEWSDILSQSSLAEASKKELDALFPNKDH